MDRYELLLSRIAIVHDSRKKTFLCTSEAVGSGGADSEVQRVIEGQDIINYHLLCSRMLEPIRPTFWVLGRASGFSFGSNSVLQTVEAGGALRRTQGRPAVRTT